MLVKKDLHMILSRRGVRSLLVVMPLLLVLVLPVIFFVFASLLPQTAAPQALLQQFSEKTAALSPSAFWAEVFTEYVCPMLYAFVPVICSVAAGSCVFISEKENGTLDTLFLSSLRAKTIYNAKVTVCTLISVLLSWAAFFLFAITASIAELLLDAPFFFNFSWLILVILVTPALSLFASVYTGMLLPRVHTMAESVQTMGYLLLPIALLCLLQFTGTVEVGAMLLLLCAVILLALALILYNRTSARFHAEALSDPAAEKSLAALDNTGEI